MVGLNKAKAKVRVTKVDHQNEFPLDPLHLQDEGKNIITVTKQAATTLNLIWW